MARSALRRLLSREGRDSEEFARLLYVRPAVSLERKLARRLAMVLGLFALVMALFWLERENLKDDADGVISLGDVVYFTMVTVTTVGYGDIVPVGERARLIDALLVTPVRIFVWFIFLGTAYELVFQRVVEDLRMNRLREALREHVIICGFGYAGRVACREVVAQGIERERVMVIDLRADRLEDCAAAGYIGLRGDATSEAVMKEAGTARARAVLVALPRDDTAVLAVLTARSLNERARIIALVRDEENIKLVRKAGADEVVSPARIGGFLLADAVSSRWTTRFVTDVLTARGGELRIAERRALPDEVGKRIDEVRGRLVVALERDGTVHGFWNAPGEVIRETDLVFAIEARQQP